MKKVMTFEEYEVFNEAITNMAEAICMALYPAWQAIKKVGQACCDMIWKGYGVAGMPYGASDEGMWRWAHECAKAERLRREADEIELYHRQMAAFRKMIAERKGQDGRSEGTGAPILVQ